MVRTLRSTLARSVNPVIDTAFKMAPARAAFGLLLGLGGASVHAAPGNAPALSIDEAVRLAEERSRELPAYGASAQAARDMAVAAGQRPDPIVTVGVNNLPINGPDRFSIGQDFMTMRSVSIMQQFTREAKLEARSGRYEREAQASEADRQLAQTNLERDTSIAWFDRYFAEQSYTFLVAERDEAKLQVQAAEAAYRGARGSQADVFAARAAVAQIDDRIEQAQQEVTSAKTQLSRWVGASANAPLAAPPAADVVRLHRHDLPAELRHHPEIAAMLRREAVAQAEVDEARAEKKTDFSAELMYSQRGPAYSNLVSINISFPLEWDQTNRQDRELAAKLAAVDQMRDEREEATRTHVAEAETMLQEWDADRKRLRRYDGSLLPLATDRTQAALAAYRGGTGPLEAVLDARRAEIDAHLDRLRIQAAADRLWAQINAFMPNDRENADAAWQEEQ